MIESTASRRAGVTSSACTGMSTWQLGAKHSITKRSTRGARREVRVSCMARPRRVSEPRMVLSSQVARGLAGHFARGRPQAGSWLKTYGCGCAKPSAFRGVRQGSSGARRAVASTAVRPGRRLPGRSRDGRARRPRGRARGRPLRVAQHHTAGRRDGSEPQCGRGRSADRASVHDQHDRYEQTAEGGPAHHVARRVGSGGESCPTGRARRARSPQCAPRSVRSVPRGSRGGRGGCAALGPPRAWGGRCSRHGCSLGATGWRTVQRRAEPPGH